MYIILNGEQTAISSRTLLAMVQEKGFDPDSVIAEVNLQLIKKNDWEQTTLAEGDTVELLSFVGGGRPRECCQNEKCEITARSIIGILQDKMSHFIEL
ncbi:MAG: sulfur carrier protein ThiS [Candidatus Electrothrix sp. EH2]|nr:sulfur carrier protein ThiS [Candidatus Electrothrix sp. EH2]